MSIEIFIPVAVAFVFLYFGNKTKDYATFIFSSITFFLSGLKIVLDGDYSLGLLLIGFGAYIGFRSGIELTKEELEQWQKKRKMSNLISK